MLLQNSTKLSLYLGISPSWLGVPHLYPEHLFYSCSYSFSFVPLGCTCFEGRGYVWLSLRPVPTTWQLTCKECSPQSRLSSKNFIWTNYLIYTTQRWVLLSLFLFYRQGKWGTERLGHMPSGTQVVIGRTWMWAQEVCSRTCTLSH